MVLDTYSRPSLPNFEDAGRLSSGRLSTPETKAQLRRIAKRLEPWLAFAVVAVTAAASWGASTWLLQQWAFR